MKLIIIAIFFSSLISCKPQNERSKNTDQIYQISEVTDIEQDVVTNIEEVTAEEETAKLTGGEIAFPNESPNVTTSGLGIIQYPYFSNIDFADEINSIILEEVRWLNTACEGASSDSTISYYITLDDERYLSLFLDGITFYSGAAHPSRLSLCILIDKNNGKRLRLRDIITIDDNFIGIFVTHADFVFKKFGGTILEREENLLEKLRNADYKMPYEDMPEYLFPPFQTYLTGEDLVIRIEVAHAIGDYVDVFLPKSILN
ncbi:MAG: DUF4163 domain-containing protein [Treponema sp.]|jgi:hypothetical protein|nr:DUF4163 domain-containing protein [Treponema sp.]